MIRKEQLVLIDIIEQKIFYIFGKKVMLDRDLAELYGVKTKVLNQAVSRNIQRFPADFMFRLTKHEKDELVTNCDRFDSLKHSSVMPRAFTQEGVAMLSTVLNSERAIQVNIQIMRAFIKLRILLASHPTQEEFEGFKRELLKKIETTEKKYNVQFQAVFQVIKQLVQPQEKPKRKIGF